MEVKMTIAVVREVDEVVHTTSLGRLEETSENIPITNRATLGSETSLSLSRMTVDTLRVGYVSKQKNEVLPLMS